MRAGVPPPALHADAVVRDGFALRSPFGFPFPTGAGIEPGHAGGPRMGAVFPALDGQSQCVDRGGVVEEVAQRAGRAGGFHAEDAAAVGGAGEDVLVGLEG